MGENIVREPAEKIREIARNALRERWWTVIIAFLIVYLVGEAVGTVLDGFFYYPRTIYILGEAHTYAAGYGGRIYGGIIGGALAYGISLYSLMFFRNRESEYGLIFEGFSHFLKCFLLSLLIGIKILLWSLLFVIPGFIAAFRYSQSFLVMIDHPEYSIGECIKESCRIMEGNKGRFFYLQLTFIGWSILAALPAMIVGINSNMSATSIVGINIGEMIMDIVLGLPSVAVAVYICISNIAFYELATKHLVVVPEEYNQNPFGV